MKISFKFYYERRCYEVIIESKYWDEAESSVLMLTHKIHDVGTFTSYMYIACPKFVCGFYAYDITKILDEFSGSHIFRITDDFVDRLSAFCALYKVRNGERSESK